MSFLIFGCTNTKEKKESSNKEDEKVVVEEDKRVSFVAVGDNLIHGGIYYDAAQRNGGVYDFNSMYENTNYITQEADIAFINQETILGGVELGLSSYPTFNSPSEVSEAVVNAGFDWINHASNHTLDRGEKGIINALNTWDKYQDVVVTGIARSEEERNAIKIIERNGIKFGLLSYTYGTNGIPIPEGKEYLVNLIDKEQIIKDVRRLKNECDVMIVNMHWGDEYSNTPNNQQKELAQLLADEGVMVIIGEHPHVIQPMDWVIGKNGNKTLVMYSLGNFLSAQDRTERMLGGMVTWDILKDGKTKEYKIENVEFLPTVTHINKGVRNYKTYVLKDYTDDLAKIHRLNGVDGNVVSRQFFIDYVNNVMGDQFKIVY